MLAVKEQVIAQFGKNSDQVPGIGLEEKVRIQKTRRPQSKSRISQVKSLQWLFARGKLLSFLANENLSESCIISTGGFGFFVELTRHPCPSTNR
jgi:hypothetical protein